MSHGHQLRKVDSHNAGDDRIVSNAGYYLPLDYSLKSECVDARPRSNRPPTNPALRSPAAGLGLLGIRAVVETAHISGAVSTYDLLGAAEAGGIQLPNGVTVHDRTCRRIAHDLEVVGHRAAPDEAAQEKLGRWAVDAAAISGLSVSEIHDALRLVEDVSERQVALIEEQGTPPLDETIDRVAGNFGEDHVSRIVGDPSARGYLTILAPDITFDEAAAHNNHTQLYVDTLGSTIRTINRDWDLSPRDRAVATAAALSDTVATQTALASLHTEHGLRQFEATMVPKSGLYVAELL
ncbi:MAG TPA: hypothetical protein VLI54_04780 [Bacillota bacterium]|nr:hypothetical protein [Bacillota bacterium]